MLGRRELAWLYLFILDLPTTHGKPGLVTFRYIVVSLDRLGGDGSGLRLQFLMVAGVHGNF
jgi:hypothetical protein